MRAKILFLGILLLGFAAGLIIILWNEGAEPPAPADDVHAAPEHPGPIPPGVGPSVPGPGLKKPPAGTDPASAAADAAARPGGTSGVEDPGGTVTGVVRNEAGAPIGNATVRIIRRHARSDGKHEMLDETTRTGADGRFAFSGIDSRKFLSVHVVAHAPGYFRERTTTPLGRDVAIVLGPPGVLTGRVTMAGAGTPVAGATVAIKGIGLDAERSVTDARGHYRLEDLKPETHEVAVTSADRPPLRGVRVEVKPGRATVANFQMKPGFVLCGRVLDATTRVPIRGASVQAGSYAPDVRSTVTDAEGTFLLKGLVNGNRLMIRAEGHVTLTTVFSGARPRGKEPGPIREFALTRAASIEGRVSGADGRPLGDVEVRAYRRRPWDGDQAKTDSDGAFRLLSVPVGVEVRLLARKPGFAQTVSDPMILRSGEARTGSVIRLTAGAVIAGRLTDPAGAPITKAKVRLIPASWDHARAYGASPDRDGRYRIETVAAGSYNLEVRARDLVGQQRAFPVEKDAAYPGVDFVLSRGLTLTGRVTDQTGRTVADALVTSIPVTPAKHQVREVKRATTDADGRFALRALPAGRYRLIPIKEGHRRIGRGIVVRAGAEDVLLNMIRLHKGIAGNVVRADSGAPVAEFFVRCNSRRRRFADAEGRFALKDLRPGVYFLEAGTDDGLISSRIIRIELAIGTDPGLIELRVAPGAALAGRVLAPDRTPLSQARIVASYASGEPGGEVATATSERDGRFEIGPLRPAAYRIRVSHRDWIPVERTVTARAGGADPIEVRLLAEGGVFRITVTDARGQPVKKAQLTIRSQDGSALDPETSKHERYLEALKRRSPDIAGEKTLEGFFRTGALGVVERRFLPPGRYTVEVSKRGYRTARIKAEAQGGVTTEVAVTLGPAK